MTVEPPVREKMIPSETVVWAAELEPVESGRTGTGLRYAVLSMTVDKPTSIEPLYELEPTDPVVDGSAELLLPSVGETSLAGIALELGWPDAEPVIGTGRMA